jgi:hypothetical protein
MNGALYHDVWSKNKQLENITRDLSILNQSLKRINSWEENLMTEEQARECLIIYEVMMIILMRNGAIDHKQQEKSFYEWCSLYNDCKTY